MKETIHLDEADGFEFEVICQRILEGLGYQVERIGGVGDGGRDLIAHFKGEKIIVECKLYSNSSVGRPIIQKLHSVMVTDRASRGMVMTTGQFSNQAREHALEIEREHGLQIKLIDSFQLTDWAHRAGLQLVSQGTPLDILSFAMLDYAQVMASILAQAGIYSHPTPFKDLVQIKRSRVHLQASYFVQADIEKDFYTSSRQLIHSVHQQDYTLLFDAQGQPYPDRLVFFLTPAGLHSPLPLPDLTQEPFQRSVAEIKAQAIDTLINQFSRQVSYRARNNRHYHKQCLLKPKDIYISNLKQVYVPHYHYQIQILKQDYEVEVLHDGQQALVMQQNLNRCGECDKKLRPGKIILCHECGRLGHKALLFWWSSHGFHCPGCHQTTCRHCGHHRGWLKRQFCGRCA